MSRIIKKAWKIPVIPEMTAQIEFLAELLKAENPVEEEVD
jgi:hypothetical protein